MIYFVVYRLLWYLNQRNFRRSFCINVIVKLNDQKDFIKNTKQNTKITIFISVRTRTGSQCHVQPPLQPSKEADALSGMQYCMHDGSGSSQNVESDRRKYNNV